MEIVQIIALVQVILIDLAMSGDNAIVIALAANGLEEKKRKKAIALGVVCAIILRIALSVIAVYLLRIPYLSFAGGLLLLWVSWDLFQDLRRHKKKQEVDGHKPTKTMSKAIKEIVIADASMSLDNVLAVAGAARDHIEILVIGLVLSIVFMAVASNLIATMMKKWPWIAYAGLLMILYTAVMMIMRG